MTRETIHRIRAAIADEGVDVLLTASPENFAYVTGFLVPSQPLMRWRHAMALVPAVGEPGAVVVDMEESTVRRQLPAWNVRPWGEFTDDPMEVLARFLEAGGLAGGRIGLEMDYMPAGDFARLCERLPRARFEAAEQLLARLRQVKTPHELELLRRLSRISDRAILDAYRAVEAGMTEMDLAAALTRSVYAQGAENFKLLIVATGERSQLPNVGPTDRVLQAGDVCRVEIFAAIGGYHAGVCRTAVVQQAPPHAERIWANLTACKHLLLEHIGPGASTRRIYETYLAKLSELDLPPIAFVGHGIGVHLHEEPYLGPYSDATLKPGMVLGIEPLTYRTGHGYGMQNKDMVAVTEDGCELLSDVTDSDRLIVVS